MTWLLALALMQSLPSGFDANHAAGEKLAREGKPAEAVPFLERAFRANPVHQANAYDLGLVYLQAGQLDKARAHVRALLAKDPRADLHNLLGAIEEAANNPDEAGRQYQEAAQKDPAEKHLFDFGAFMLKYNQLEPSVQIFRFGVEKYPKSARLWSGLGVVLYSKGEYDAAVESLCQAVDLDPKDARPLFFLQKMYDVSPKLAGEVRGRLARFVELYPNNGPANYYYAMSLWKRWSGEVEPSNLAEVERLLKRSIAQDPAFGDAHLNLGILYEESNRLPLAVSSYEQAVKRMPESDTAHFRLGKAYLRAGRTAEGRREMDLYKTLHDRRIAAPVVENTTPPK